VYDAELHAVQEAVSTLLTSTAPRIAVVICIDNQAAIATLNFIKHNHECRIGLLAPRLAIVSALSLPLM